MWPWGLDSTALRKTQNLGLHEYGDGQFDYINWVKFWQYGWMSTFKGKQYVGEKFVVMSSQAAVDEVEAVRLSDGWGRKDEVVH